MVYLHRLLCCFVVCCANWWLGSRLLMSVFRVEVVLCLFLVGFYLRVLFAMLFRDLLLLRCFVGCLCIVVKWLLFYCLDLVVVLYVLLLVSI